MRFRLLMTTLSLAVVLLAVGCGSGESSDAGGPSQPGTTQSETEAPPPPATGTAVEPAPAAPTPASGAAPWPDPPNTLEAIAQAGLEPLRQELLAFHIHSHLDVFVNGEPIVIPQAIGINLDDPGLQRGEGCEDPCISPLHTHDTTGIIHIESAEDVPFTLGQFFAEWNVRLDSDCVGGYCKPDAPISISIDGEPFEGDPSQIRLKDREEIAIVIGTPPAVAPDSYEGFKPVA